MWYFYNFLKHKTENVLLQSYAYIFLVAYISIGSEILSLSISSPWACFFKCCKLRAIYHCMASLREVQE